MVAVNLKLGYNGIKLLLGSICGENVGGYVVISTGSVPIDDEESDQLGQLNQRVLRRPTRSWEI